MKQLWVKVNGQWQQANDEYGLCILSPVADREDTVQWLNEIRKHNPVAEFEWREVE